MPNRTSTFGPSAIKQSSTLSASCASRKGVDGGLPATRGRGKQSCTNSHQAAVAAARTQPLHRPHPLPPPPYLFTTNHHREHDCEKRSEPAAEQSQAVHEVHVHFGERCSSLMGQHGLQTGHTGHKTMKARQVTRGSMRELGAWSRCWANTRSDQKSAVSRTTHLKR